TNDANSSIIGQRAQDIVNGPQQEAAPAPAVDPGVVGALTLSDAEQLLMLVRGQVPPDQGDDAALATGVRQLTGVGNNQADPSRASLDTPFIRLTEARYGLLDQANNKAGINPIFKGIDPRTISNLIGAQQPDTAPSDQASTLFMEFAQYFDHGLSFLPKGGNGTIVIGNQIPGDANNPADLTRATISGWGENGLPVYLNQDTPYVDQNQAYGPNEAIGQLLRCSDGNQGFAGKLICSGSPDPSAPGQYLLPNLRELLDSHIDAASTFTTPDGPKTLLEVYPGLRDSNGNYNENQVRALVANFMGTGYNLLIDANPAINPLEHVISGDGRVNENVALSSMHAVWVRNHNYHALQLQKLYTDHGMAVSEEELFQAAKIVNEAEYQRVVFTEFAEKVLGGVGIRGEGDHGFKDYNPDADASISLEFQAIAYRLGHTMIGNDQWVLDANGVAQPKPLVDLFLNPTNDPSAFSVDHDRNPNTPALTGDAALAALAQMGYMPQPGYAELGTGAILGGIAQQPAEEVDGQMVDAVRNELVRVRADLYSANVARGWDLGMGTLNQIKIGLLASTSPYVQEAISYVGADSLHPYSSWNDFQSRNNLSDAVINQFKAAYPDLVLSQAEWDTFQGFNPEITAIPSGDSYIVKGIDRVDAWVGGIVEAKVDVNNEGAALVGPTFWVILHEQLDRLQEADRHYYISRLENLPLYSNFVEDTTFAKIIARNTGLTNLPDNVFDVFKPNEQANPQPNAPTGTGEAGAGGTGGTGETTDAEDEQGDDSSAEDGPAKSNDAVIQLGLSIVKDPVFDGDATNDIVLRQFGNNEEQASTFYLALTAESLRDAAINTLDFSIHLGEAFGEAFALNPADIHFNETLNVARRVQISDGPDGPVVRFNGAGLDALENSGAAIDGSTVLAYIQLQQRSDIDQLIKDARTEDSNGFRNTETFNVAQLFQTSVNVDQIVWDDLLSLRDLGGSDAVVSSDLEVTVRAAQAELTTDSSFNLGTTRQITKPGESGFTNLIRSGDTIWQTSTWRNDGEFTFTDLTITDLSDDVATVTSVFDANNGAKLEELGWSAEAGEGEVASISSKFQITGAAGSVLDTTKVGFKLDAYGDYHWNTTEMDQFAIKHLITYAGDLNYDGAVTFKDLGHLNAGAATGSNPHDVDANFDGMVDMLDLAVLDADWGMSLHSGEDTFLGSNAISMAELFQQNGRTWDSSAFAEQNAIESNTAAGAEYVNVLTDISTGLITGPVAGVDELDQLLQQQQYATTV
ncbi:hypothetical protein NZK27_11540, partial [Synechococcus sp. FGCU-3]|nr:hypothetical protein [Synechococcus sp. FGCU3]